jgi:hypothetical protein
MNGGSVVMLLLVGKFILFVSSIFVFLIILRITLPRKKFEILAKLGWFVIALSIYITFYIFLLFYLI